jgi:hypothetical protein
MKKRFTILFIFFVSATLRLWKLGEIPQGLSLSEVEFGLRLSKYIGTWILNPIFIRLSFAILGIISILLTFLLIKKLTGNLQLSFVSSFLLAISPWHIAQSRIYSLGMTAFVLALLISLFVSRKTNFDFRKLVKFSIVIFVLAFIFSVFSIGPDIKYKVDEQRNIASMSEFNFLSRIFSNKIIESYRCRRALLFENFDLGNYFFSGHPRERWGVEETPKLFVLLFPLIVFGLFIFDKKLKKLKMFVLIWSLLLLPVFVFYKLRGPGETLLMVLPLTTLAAVGLSDFYKKKRWIYKLVFFIAISAMGFELAVFCSHYFSGLNESQFFPRRSHFENLVQEVDLNKKVEEGVLISQKLGNPEPFFQFYLKDEKLEICEFRTFDIWEEELSKLFVDVLPDGALPSEPLYTDDGSWPKKLDFVGKHYDVQRRQTVFLYRKK